MIWIVFIAAIFNLVLSLIMNTQNFASALIFKVIPFFLGLGCLFYFIKTIGWI